MFENVFESLGIQLLIMYGAPMRTGIEYVPNVWLFGSILNSVVLSKPAY